MSEKLDRRRTILLLLFLASIFIVLIIPSKETFITCGFTLGLVAYDLFLGDNHWYVRQINNQNQVLLWDVKEMDRLRKLIESLGGEWKDERTSSE